MGVMFDGMFALCSLFDICIERLQWDFIFTKIELQPWKPCLHRGLPVCQKKKSEKKRKIKSKKSREVKM